MIILACDHAGFMLKEQVKSFFNSENITTIDVGAYSTEPSDYPDFAKAGCERVLEHKQNVGIIICGTGIGMSIACNRNPNIRAALCHKPEIAALARKHNDANVLVLAGRYLSKNQAIKIIKMFLTTDFEKGRHALRLKKL
ncbi:MAG: ribose 5-phosphate isomerase B [Clostridia bacterium]|jgi:ribose 5-phosphate isomerase B|nr:ribose 5-phosphate isomerase B [Clostridia bacterium]MDD3231885.1 ribose 5-phosphate isomerase B [Clostridia bacterium]MDD3862854.1 ribose 5-phosphate isomerase B [Clostridia bacterium]MDD4408683.1 ribose 5-phosphate isomerase B [Clostridia bacterium]